MSEDKKNPETFVYLEKGFDDHISGYLAIPEEHPWAKEHYGNKDQRDHDVHIPDFGYVRFDSVFYTLDLKHIVITHGDMSNKKSSVITVMRNLQRIIDSYEPPRPLRLYIVMLEHNRFKSTQAHTVISRKSEDEIEHMITTEYIRDRIQLQPAKEWYVTRVEWDLPEINVEEEDWQLPIGELTKK